MYKNFSNELFVRWNVLLFNSMLLGYGFASNILTEWQLAVSSILVFLFGAHTYYKITRLYQTIEFGEENDDKREVLIYDINSFMEDYTNAMTIENFTKSKLIEELSNYLKLQQKESDNYEPLDLDYEISKFDDAIAEIENFEEKIQDQRIIEFMNILKELKTYQD